MQLPPALRAAVDLAFEGISLADISAAADALSRRYRAEVQDGRFHLADDMTARAYLATRLPATYGATLASLNAAARARPDFAPATLLDVGAGPGSATWAASQCWPGITDALMVEAAGAIRVWGERFAARLPVKAVSWRGDDILASGGTQHIAPRDLVCLAYVLSEVAPQARPGLVAKLWTATAGMLLIVEPGTPAGWRRVLDARDELIRLGGHIVAPCPHAQACPVHAPDWCHFAARVERSRVHRLAKDADVPWEDEKFIYVAAARAPAQTDVVARVIAPPRAASGRVALKLCKADGAMAQTLVTRRSGDAYKRARRLDWGDAVED